MAYVEKHGLQVEEGLAAFVETQALPGTDVAADAFWAGLSELVHVMGPKNRALLQKRDDLKGQIDAWHIERRGQDHDPVAYKSFLKDIGYLVPKGAPFSIQTENVDPEIANVPGPQLVVPIMNARYALNAANARWGSLYDALYGTDAMGSSAPAGGYSADRGAAVIAWAKTYLDEAFALASGSHSDVAVYTVVDGTLSCDGVALKDAAQFAGYRGDAAQPSAILLKTNGLHAELVIDRTHQIGSVDKAGVADVLLESAMSSIMDCEDSVAAVDAEDKILAYSNWLGLMRGDLKEQVVKGGKTITRALNPDREYTAPDGSSLSLKGRALMLVRNVGHLMTNPAILDRDGLEIGEGLMDAMCTALCAIHDFKRDSGNSVKGSMYVVKPKMHGPEEVAFADEIFSHVEQVLGLPQNTVKMGIMDEERRTSVNLKECIRAAKGRSFHQHRILGSYWR